MNYSRNDLFEQAKKLGAVSHCVFSVKKKFPIYSYTSEAETTEFAYHFFDKNEEEVCYYIVDTVVLLGMKVFDSPRKWSDTSKQNPAYNFISWTH